MGFTRVGARALLAGVVTGALLLPLQHGGPPAGAQPAQHRLHPSAVPATTPNLLDGRTLAIAESGTWAYVGGTFTTSQNPGTSAALPTPYLLRYDRRTGVVDQSFAPRLDAEVTALAVTPDGSALFVAGTFKTAGTTKVRNLVKLDTATGALAAGFKNPSPNGSVLDLALTGGRILLAGTFTTVNTVPHGGLAALNATTGAVDEYVGIDVAVNHNWPAGTAKAPVGVGKISVTPDGSRMVAIGNFKQADGLDRDQVMQVRLGPDAATVDPTWRTLRYTPACLKDKFDSYVRDVDYSPDGSYFVVVSSGAGFNGTLCDSAARFDTTAVTQAAEPVWVAASGADSLLSVAVADTAVYVGGHQKWMNAIQSGSDEQAGQVPRPGLAALDPLSGVPLSWNPGRHPRGVGAEELLATDNGLYVGSDTQYIGNQAYRRERIAFFPVAGGTAPVTQADPVLPRSLYRVSGTTTTTREFTGSSATAPTTVATTGAPSWTNVRGAFMIGSRLVHGWTDGKLHTRTFDGNAFGPDVVIDPYNDPAWSTVTTSGGTQTYRGRVPGLYTQMSSVTAMAYADGRLYYTRQAQSRVFWRWFSPESLVVGAQEFTVTGSTLPGGREARNLFYAAGNLWAGLSNNELHRLAVVDGVASGSWSRVTGAGIDTAAQWSSGTMFLGPVANAAPTPSITSSCTGQTCSFDGRGSSDADGTVTAWAWDFGDGGTSTASSVDHVYAGPGTYRATLTVTDEDGASASASTDVVIEGATSTVGFRDATGKVSNATSIATPVPATVQPGDGLVAVVSASTTAVPAAPAGWTQVGAPATTDAMTTVAWQRVAVDGDAGRNVSVVLGTTAVKATLTVLAYSGTSPDGPVAAVAGAGETTATTAHRSPVVTSPGGWVVTVWSDRSSTTTSLVEPTGSTLRHRLIGTGGAHVDTVVADTGGPVAAGPYGDRVATADAAAKGTSLSIALR